MATTKTQRQSKYLTQIQASQRYSQISQQSILYKLYLNLMIGDHFLGFVDIDFKLNNISQDLFIDYNNEEIISVQINDQLINNLQQYWDGLFLTIPKQYLLEGQNNLQIHFKGKYAHDGSGLCYFEDIDKKQYIYSQCEPYACNRIFPNFDQPDLKAYLELTIQSPKQWVLLSNEEGRELTHLSNENQNTKLIEFPRTKLLPTYLFGIVAGYYKGIKCEKSYRNIKMKLYCRESLYEYLKNLSEYFFEVTNKSMEFYEQFFGYKYPFNKYDQIFCAEYNMGAMENAGMVTFNDNYLFREAVDSSKYTWLGNCIAHELSHHWFGNLVTMKWWNDLWLNESFADFVSHFCLSKVKIQSNQTQNIWLAFNSRKSWGYRTDQLITTHPIAGEVPNTEAADSIFDGITYAKGAATLRQLLSLIGEEQFSKAMKTYFNKYAFQNTVLDDFIQVLDEEFQKKKLGFTLIQWKNSWICKAGLNECQPLFTPTNSKNAQLVIKQSSALKQFPTLRNHKMKVAFFKENCEIVTYDIILEEKEDTILNYDGSENFKAVLLNYGDEAFIKVLLDENSLKFFENNINLIKDDLSRTLIWRAFYDLVRDGKLSSEEYIDIFTRLIEKEPSDDLLVNQIKFINSSLSTLTPKKYRTELSSRLFEWGLTQLKHIPKEKKARILAIKQELPFYAKTDEKIQTIVDWLMEKNSELKDIEIGNNTSWDIVTKAYQSKSLSLDEKKQIFQYMANKDPSDTMKNIQQRCIALVSTKEEKEQLWESYFSKDNKLSLRQMQFSWMGFNNSDNNPEEMKVFYDKYYAKIKTIFQEQSIEFSKYFIDFMYPKTEDFEYLENKNQQILSEVQSTQTQLIRHIKEEQDDIERTKKAYQCFFKRAKMVQK